MNIGILAIQGSVVEHRRMLEQLGVNVTEVKLPEDLDKIDGLIIPGGESTAISKLMKRYNLFEPLKRLIEAGLPVWGTCAGAILLAKNVTGKNPPPTLEVMDIEVERNGYGRHCNSFIKPIGIQDSGFPPKERTGRIQSLKGVFIRAPRLKPGENLTVLATHEGEPVMLRQENMLVTSFHPELTEEATVHQYFLEMCNKKDRPS